MITEQRIKSNFVFARCSRND